MDKEPPSYSERDRQNTEKEKKTEVLVSVDKLRDDLKEQGYRLISDREKVSGGVYGPINTVEVEDITTGEKKKLLEKTYTVGGVEGMVQKGKGYLRTAENTGGYQSFLQVIDGPSGRVDYIINWAVNEERAMRDLQDIPGIPKFICRSTDGIKSSTLMEYIDGEDLDSLFMSGNIDVERATTIFEKVNEIIIRAAERGYVHLDMDAATIMIDVDDQPYITDWHHLAEVERPANSDLVNEQLRLVREKFGRNIGSIEQQQIAKIRDSIS